MNDPTDWTEESSEPGACLRMANWSMGLSRVGFFPRRYGDEKPAEGERVLVWRGDAWEPAVHDGWGELSDPDELWLPMPPDP